MSSSIHSPLRHYLLTLAVVSLLIAQSAMAANFVCDDPEFAAAAEQAREQSARFWTGQLLPGDWFQPAPIVFTPTPRSHGNRARAGGVTSFQFDHGEVFGWRMQVFGPRAEILADVIPHEVDHMVRASLVRRPIERWLDEGCAALFESPTSQEQFREIARQTPASIVTSQWLAEFNYPNSGESVRQLYAVGHSLVEYLLTLDEPQQLLALQQTPGQMAARLQSHYRLNSAELINGWDRWRRLGKRQSQPTDNALATQDVAGGNVAFRCGCQHPARPLLIIWTADWCGPCRRFQHDWRSDPEFRRRLQQEFHIHHLDWDQHRQLAMRQGIQTLPTFQLATRRISGYHGAEDLLQRLLPATPAVSEVPETTEVLEQATTTTADGAAAVEVADFPAAPTSVRADDSEAPSVSEPTVAEGKAAAHPSQAAEQLPELILTGVTLLQWAGVIGGSVATGGIAGVALTLLPLVRKRRAARRRASTPATRNPHSGLATQPTGSPATSTATPAATTTGSLPQPLPTSPSAAEPGTATQAPPERSECLPRAPFPRELDEARELLELRQSEGRVVVLDALRGMFLDDELAKLKTKLPAAAHQHLNDLQLAIYRRLDEVAPLSTRYPEADG